MTLIASMDATVAARRADSQTKRAAARARCTDEPAKAATPAAAVADFTGTCPSLRRIFRAENLPAHVTTTYAVTTTRGGSR